MEHQILEWNLQTKNRINLDFRVHGDFRAVRTRRLHRTGCLARGAWRSWERLLLAFEKSKYFAMNGFGFAAALKRHRVSALNCKLWLTKIIGPSVLSVSRNNSSRINLAKTSISLCGDFAGKTARPGVLVDYWPEVSGEWKRKAPSLNKIRIRNSAEFLLPRDVFFSNPFLCCLNPRVWLSGFRLSRFMDFKGLVQEPLTRKQQASFVRTLEIKLFSEAFSNKAH